MAANNLGAILLLTIGVLLFSLQDSEAYRQCADLSTPSQPLANLTFCTAYSALSCCSVARDLQLASEFQALGISNASCGAVAKQILCAECDPWSSHLYGVVDGLSSPLPYLCTSPTTTFAPAYCIQAYSACSSSVVTDLTNTSTPLSSTFPDAASFCKALAEPASASSSFCYAGTPVSGPPAVAATAPVASVCLQKVGNGTYLNMVPIAGVHDKVFVAGQYGKVRLVNISSSGALVGEQSTPFLDLSARVLAQNENGLLGLAVHPNYAINGKIYVAYSCNQTLYPDCYAECQCSPAFSSNCDPVVLRANQSDSCTVATVIAEYTAARPLLGPAAMTETKRILTIGKPYANNNGGQLFFGRDGFLYFGSGDGGGVADPWDFAQDKKSLLGKILRLDVNSPTTTANYSIPTSNPFVGQAGAAGEIYALGLRNPWRCSIDSQRPSYLFCGDVSLLQYEEVDLISMGGNYGWSVYEGNKTLTRRPGTFVGATTAPSTISVIPPVLQYDLRKTPSTPQAVTGGYVYRGTEDKCLAGKYVYADLYGSLFAATEVPANSGAFDTVQIDSVCSGTDSPLSCGLKGAKITIPYIFSFGEDANGTLYFLGPSTVHRVVAPSLCGFTQCGEAASLVTPTNTSATAPAPVAGPAAAPVSDGISRSSASLVLQLCALLGALMLMP